MAIPLTAQTRAEWRKECPTDQDSHEFYDTEFEYRQSMRVLALLDALYAREAQLAEIVARVGWLKRTDIGTMYVECDLCVCATEPDQPLNHYPDCPLFTPWAAKEQP